MNPPADDDEPLGDPAQFPWDEVGDLQKFRSRVWTRRIEATSDCALLGAHFPICQSRLKGLARVMRSHFTAKDEIIDLMIVAAIAQQPMLLLGPPGVAKTALVMRLCEGLGLPRATDAGGDGYFKYMLHPFTEPDEVLGVLDIRALTEQKKFVRHRAGSITDAVLVFLDEVFRGNSAILNGLLGVINERRVYEGGAEVRACARLIYGAANLLPVGRQREEIGAFVERFVVRAYSAPVRTEVGPQTSEIQKARNELLTNGWRREVAEQRVAYDPVKAAIEPIACLNDILLCNRAAVELWGGTDLTAEDIRDFVPQFHQVVNALVTQRPPLCLIDDRKLVKLFMLVRANSLFARGSAPRTEDLLILQHTWDDPDSRELLKRDIERHLAPSPPSAAGGS